MSNESIGAMKLTAAVTSITTEEHFSTRHIGPSAGDVEEMLGAIGCKSLDQLIAEAIPDSIRLTHDLPLARGLSEAEALRRIAELSRKNHRRTSMIGQGYYGTFLPPVIQRNVLENPAWYTSYTPYQPEISQGRMEALLNFQTMVADLAGLEVANASLLDEGSAAAEAVAMAHRVSETKLDAVFVDDDCHPQTIAVLRTRAEPLGWRIVVGDPDEIEADRFFAAVLQYPGSSGRIRDFGAVIGRLRAASAIAIMAADPLALTMLKPPGELGADIAVGSTQRFGVPMGFGGPHAAYIATHTRFVRALPGRLVGVSVDSRGAQAYRLTLQTREQHIRRERATSNICTAQALLAIIASFYAVYHGPEGLKRVARRVHQTTAHLAQELRALGWRITSDTFFDTLTVDVGDQDAAILARADAEGLNFRIRPVHENHGRRLIGLSCDETTTAEIVEAVLRAFGPNPSRSAGQSTSPPTQGIPRELERHSPFMTHPVFNEHHSETEMLRYMRRLADRDLALDRAMIPLGSCTMKLNATSEMLPITWPQFADMHPFAPKDQAVGYTELIGDLGAALCTITGFDAISLQPNSGAQGEYAGLLTIRAYHRSRGEEARDICLIPASAHGTNPASAHMAGMHIVVVGCEADGNVDLVDLGIKAEQHRDKLAALMITYPSTHGVFEPRIRDICETVHRHGGQIYLDGANMNAQVGLARPGDYGADVCHLNLHKTFCIPHGGGGPGVGPIAVKRHLARFLPGHPERPDLPSDVGPVASAPFGSASILPIAWMYIVMMGAEGLTDASKVAILNANYVAARLSPHYPLLFKGQHGRVAHECIIDLRPFKQSADVTAEDVAKRLIDYGFHAPTMSFPVAGTLMIEPTESESKMEIDRFCEAMIAIRAEIRAVEQGHWSRTDNPLRNAPHTVFDLAEASWSRSYSREQGCFPAGSRRRDKYWAPVNRVDNVAGDRNLVCSCPPIEELAAAE